MATHRDGGNAITASLALPASHSIPPVPPCYPTLRAGVRSVTSTPISPTVRLAASNVRFSLRPRRQKSTGKDVSSVEDYHPEEIPLCFKVTLVVFSDVNFVSAYAVHQV